MRLYEDFDQDGIADGPAIRDLFTSFVPGSEGIFVMTNLPQELYNPGLGQYILEANFASSLYTALSFTDLNTISGGHDLVVDTLPVVAGVTDPANLAVRIPVRKQKINGEIRVVADLT